MRLLSIAMSGVLWITAAQFTVSAGPVSAPVSSNSASNSIGPRIQFDSLVYDFGKIISGKTVRHDFVFTNTGDEDLVISGVHPSCGCTMAGSWTRKVAPGKTGLIPLLFNSGHYNNEVVKTASVVCNDRTHPQVVLQIRGTIWKPIELDPPTAFLNLVEDAPTNPAATVRIISHLTRPIALSDPVSSDRTLKVELKTVRPGKEFRLIVRRVPPLKRGPTQGVITLKTSSREVPQIQVNTYANVQPAWLVMPREIVLPAGPLRDSFPRVISIRNNLPASMALSDPVVNAKNVSVGVREIIAGHQFVLTATFPGGFKVAKGQHVDLTVKTNDPKHPIIKVPVLQLPASEATGGGLPSPPHGPAAHQPAFSQIVHVP